MRDPKRGPHSSQAFRRLLPAVMVLFLAEAVTASSGVLGWSGSLALNKAWELVASVAALAAWTWSAVRRGGRQYRWQWWMVGAMASFTVGLVCWSWVQIIGETPVPTGTLGPVGFTLTPVLALLALVLRTFGRGIERRSPLTGGHRRNRVVQGLDLLIIGHSVLLFASAALANPLSRRSVMLVSNSLSYLLLAAGIVVLLRIRPPRTRDRQVMFVSLAALAYTASSILFAQHLEFGLAIAPWLETGFSACPVFFFLAALAPGCADEPCPGHLRLTARQIIQLAVPYLPLIGTILFLAAGLAIGVSLDPFEQVVLLVLMGLVILRQLVTLVENSLLLRQAEHEALHDPLTGMANRTLLLYRLERSLAACADSGKSLVLVFCDMDDFKKVNDTLGHAAGDLVLKETATRLRRCVASEDVVARIGGDEFAIVLEDAPESLDDLGGRFLAAMQEPHVINGDQHVVSASIGITCLSPDDAGMSTNDLLRSADTAMYAAKNRGKNTLAHSGTRAEKRVTAPIHAYDRFMRTTRGGEPRQCSTIVLSGPSVGFTAHAHPDHGLVGAVELDRR